MEGENGCKPPVDTATLREIGRLVVAEATHVRDPRVSRLAQEKAELLEQAADELDAHRRSDAWRKGGCDGCKPVIVNAATNQPLPPDSGDMKIVSAIWEATTPMEPNVLHRVTCEGSKDDLDCALARLLWERMRLALAKEDTRA
jgi:hypothetical protein